MSELLGTLENGSYDATYELMDRASGKDISEFAHLEKSIVDILTTPLGSRAMMRAYGSEIFEILDKPANALWRLRFYRATLRALNRWEPRLWVKQVKIISMNLPNGEIILEIIGVYLLEGRGVTLGNLRLDFQKDSPNNLT